MNFKYKDLAMFLKDSLKKKKFVIISIDGPGGAGKSLFAANISKYIPGCQIIHFDDFYYERNSVQHNRPEIGSSFDWGRLEQEVLMPLKEGKTACYQKYDWAKDELYGNYLVKPEGIIIVEGIYCTRKEIRNYYDFKIWIEVDYNLRLKRGVDRDGEDMRNKWTEEWMPKENEYISSEAHNPRESADIIICGETSEQEINDVFNIIKSKVNFI